MNTSFWRSHGSTAVLSLSSLSPLSLVICISTPMYLQEGLSMISLSFTYQFFVRGDVLVVVDRSPDAHVHRPRGVDQPIVNSL